MTGTTGTAKRIMFTEEQAREYQGARPFPHGAYVGLFDEEMLRAAERSFPPPEADHWGPGAGKFWHRYDNPREKKLEVRYKEHLPAEVQRVIDILNGEAFVSELRKLTGIADLSADSGLGGGGMHCIVPGGLLDIHSDFNRAGPAFRRLNCLLFLNEGWQESWNGDLQLWDDNGPVVRIWPDFNRLAIFSTSHTSWHGHKAPLACPPDRSRRSIATYYYSMTSPPGYTHDQGTIWWDEAHRR